jgi:hypothetical protein
MKRKAVVTVVALVLSCLIIIVIIFNEDLYRSSLEYNAYKRAKEFISESLKSPSTAKFESFKQTKVHKVGNDYYVYIVVDAQNSYGAMLRNKYTVHVSSNESAEPYIFE